MNLILSIDRRQSAAEAMATAQLAVLFAHRGVVGVDLSGDPALGDARYFVPALCFARQRSLKLAVHVAEIDRPGNPNEF